MNFMASWLLELMVKCFYFMLPAYAANMAPVLARKIRFLDYPVDFGKKINGKPILGGHKTFRGFFFGILLGVAVAYVQHRFSSAGLFAGISIVNYDKWLVLGLLLGSGALAGDAIKSFFKRRAGIEPGARFVPFDQIDFVVGALAFAMLSFEISLEVFFVTIILSFLLHIMTNHIAFYFKIRNEKW
jgi:CDP-2,3-bis-(O-geranylgeranyl)-sn-glycerol synthase